MSHSHASTVTLPLKGPLKNSVVLLAPGTTVATSVVLKLAGQTLLTPGLKASSHGPQPGSAHLDPGPKLLTYSTVRTDLTPSRVLRLELLPRQAAASWSKALYCFL